MTQVTPIILGMSLKMYFDVHRTVAWSTETAAAIQQHPAIKQGIVEPFLLPSFPMIPIVQDIFADMPMAVGAQNISAHESGAYTGEVSAQMLQQMGCRYAEIGHAERRRYFGEDDAVVAAKTAVALRHQLTPVLCIGEPERVDPAKAALTCLEQIDSALSAGPLPEKHQHIVVAYEPVWAIGATQAAPNEHVREVCQSIRAGLAERGVSNRIIYGGSAGPGLLTDICDSVDGLFLGRFAHEPAAFIKILDEAYLAKGGVFET